MPDLRKFTPLHWILVAIAAVIMLGAVVSFIGGLGFRWDPFNWTLKRAERAESQLVTARSDGAARAAEVSGAQATTRIVEQAAVDRAAATDVVHRYAIHLEASAHDPIPVPDDGADLRSVIGELCGLRPAVCAGHGDATAARAAGDGAPGLPDPRPSR
ncbi:hypothetical protein [Brevundimonas sp. UBA7664]|uniref:hypothetical protein n=1 Tax=Brevundimonas sp. UBA7664 TaxID=1946141 RepID=UPI0025B99BC6|nr:hypothetical protein [Brevundimonas sp. UBA7664]